MPWQPSHASYAPCPCGSGKKYKFCCLKADREKHHQEEAARDAEPVETEESLDLPPFRRESMESMMRGLVKGLGSSDSSESPAQDLIDQAWQSSPQEAAKLARRALEIDPASADAYVILAEQEDDMEAKLELHRRGVVAAEIALGPNAFLEHTGHFWGVLETRPYMRARGGLAHCLMVLGRFEEAVKEFVELLRLNPNDNQGHRSALAGCYCFLGRWDDLEKLMDEYEEDHMAAGAYSRALLHFMRGDKTAADNALKKALKVNPHVPGYLLGTKPLPTEMPGCWSPGDWTEAVFFAVEFGRAWLKYPDAINWLKSATARSPRR